MRTENKIIIGLLIVIIILISIDLFTENKVDAKGSSEKLIEESVKIQNEVSTETEIESVDIVALKRTEYETKLEKLQTIEDEQERFVAYKKLYDEYLEWCDFRKQFMIVIQKKKFF